MPKLFMSESAISDLKQIQRYIARDKPIAARNWVSKIRHKCRLLAKNPELGDLHAEFGKGIRCSYVGDYNVYFRRDGEVVEIMRVIRGDRDIRFL
jgi:toxin ParE1/3/4